MPSFTHTLAVYIASGMTAAGQLHAQQDAEMSGRFLPIAAGWRGGTNGGNGSGAVLRRMLPRLSALKS